MSEDAEPEGTAEPLPEALDALEVFMMLYC
jgi:hypothetical protein